MTDMMLQQFEAYSSSQLSGYDAFKKYQRGIHSNSVAAAFPYVFRASATTTAFILASPGAFPCLSTFSRETGSASTAIP